MSKTKKEPSILESWDSKLDDQYKEIITDIEDIQYEIYKADRKKKKKQKKKMKKGKIAFYDPRSKKARKRAATRLTSEKILSGIQKIFTELKPLFILLAKLIKMIICAILSLDVVKRSISTQTLNKINDLYNLCTSVGVPA